MPEQRMVQHLHREIEKLKKLIILEASTVETAMRSSLRALVEKDLKLAQSVIAGDKQVDEMEVEVEEECLKIFALYQPVAVDLRYLVAFLKLNNELERIGDLASNIAGRAASLAVQDAPLIPAQIPQMSEIVQDMLKDSLDAMVDLDGAKAKAVHRRDDKVDKIHHDRYGYVASQMQTSPNQIGPWMEIMAISRYLERIADHCTNIAEDVEYMLSGQIQRHNYQGQELND